MNAQPRSPKPQKPSPQAKSLSGEPEVPQSLPDKAAQAQADYLKWSQVAARPDLAPAEAEWARNVARSSQAAARLYQKASAYQEPPADAELANLIGITHSPPTQPPSSDQPNPRS